MQAPDEKRRPGGISPTAKGILMVAIVAILFAVLYVTVAGLFGSTTGTIPLTVDVTRDAANWTVRFTGVPGGRLPADTYLLVRNASGAIVLSRTSFEGLTVANWSANRATYIDRDPGALEVRPADRIELDAAMYPAGSSIEISDRTGLLLIKVLQ
jgi:hypothetical protein